MAHLKLALKSQTGTLKATVKGAFQILHDSPATRADYISVSGSNIFPLFFCATVCVENENFAEQLLEIWSHISKVVAFWLKLPKSKQPKCKSFESVKGAVEDELTAVKLSFFSFLASVFQLFFGKILNSGTNDSIYIF